VFEISPREKEPNDGDRITNVFQKVLDSYDPINSGTSILGQLSSSSDEDHYRLNQKILEGSGIKIDFRAGEGFVADQGWHITLIGCGDIIGGYDFTPATQSEVMARTATSGDCDLLFVLVEKSENSDKYTSGDYELTITATAPEELKKSASTLLSDNALEDANLSIDGGRSVDNVINKILNDAMSMQVNPVTKKYFSDIEALQSDYDKVKSITILESVSDQDLVIEIPRQNFVYRADLFLLVEHDGFMDEKSYYLLNKNGKLTQWTDDKLSRNLASIKNIDLSEDSFIPMSGQLPLGDYRVSAAYIDDGSELKIIGELDVYTAH
jgi:hypothetical protein